MSDTFGAAFGRLLKRRRGESSPTLTQGDLAAALYPNDENARDTRKGDISRLETGRVANPQTRTVTDIARILDISDEEIEALHKQAQMSPAEKLENLGTLSRDALELLAGRFEILQAHLLSDPDLTAQLTLKAEEYRALKSEIDGINEGVRALANLKTAAMDAIDRLDFAEVENLLSTVYVSELEIAADTAVLRARNALMRGRAEFAYELLSAISNSFAADDALAPIRKKLSYADILYAHGRRYGGDGLTMAIQMNRDTLTSSKLKKQPQLWSQAQNKLGAALREQGSRTAGAVGKALLANAVRAYRAALKVNTQSDHPVQWAMTQNNLGLALQEQGRRTAGVEGITMLADALTAVHASLSIYTQADSPVDWAMTQNNLGIALQEQGNRTAGAEGNVLMADAVTAYRAAMKLYTQADHPVDWAMTQKNLGAALQEQGNRAAGAERNTLLADAVTAYRAAMKLYTQADHPVDWAMTQENLAVLFFALAQHDSCEDRKAVLQKALAHVDKALTVYDPVNFSHDHGTATKLRDDIFAALAELG